MPIKINPASVIKARLGIQANGRVQRIFTHTCRLHMNKYVPFDIGTLATTVDERPNEIIYDQPYAKVVYYGIKDGKKINYQTDKHPLAGPYWDRRMWSAEGQDVIKEMQSLFGGQ